MVAEAPSRWDRLRDASVVVDANGVTHGWSRYRTAPDDYEDITWCNLVVEVDWAQLESKKTIDCLCCLGSDEARYREGRDA